jgi:hypothetical protein
MVTKYFSNGNLELKTLNSFRNGLHPKNRLASLPQTSPDTSSEDKALTIGQTLAGRPALLNFEAHADELLLTDENLTLNPKIFSQLHEVAAQRNFLYKNKI